MQTIFGPEHDGMGGQRTSGNSMRRMLRGIACLALLATAPQALAAPFTCDATFYQVRRDSQTHLSIVDRTQNPYALDVQYSFSTVVNAMGYNPVDNYLYVLGSSNRQLYRLGTAGTELSAVPVTGILTGSTVDAGTFDSQGNYFTALNDGTIQRITGVTGGSPAPVALTVPRQSDASAPAGFAGTTNGHLLVGDWAVNPTESNASSSVIYGTRSLEGGTMYLYRVRIQDPSGASPAAHVSRRALTGITTSNAFGTIFMDSNGMLYAYDNASTAVRGFYRIDPATGSATAVSGADSATQSDGANCPIAAALVEPTIVLNKTTQDGFGGPFQFVLTNTGQGVGSVSTAAAGSPTQVDGDAGNPGNQPFVVSAFDAAVTIREYPVPDGWELTGAQCTVAGGGAIGSFDANTATYTIPGSAMTSGAQFVCNFTNARRAVLRLQKAFAAGGRVADSDQVALAILPAGGVAQSATTTGTGAAVTSPVLVLSPAAPGVVHTLSETAAGTFVAGNYGASYACTHAGGGAGPSGSADSFDVTPAIGDDLTCVFTNTPRVADLEITKTTATASVNAGDTVEYQLVVTNRGPGDAANARVTDPVVAGLSCTTAPVCSVPGGSAATCPASPIAIGDLQGAGVAIPDLPFGSSVVLQVSCTAQ